MDLNITVGKDPISRGENQIVTVVILNSLTGKELNITVGKDPISRGENQIVTVVVLNSLTGKELDSRLYRT